MIHDTVSQKATLQQVSQRISGFFFFAIMTSEMKLDDLIQERQLSHPEFF